MARSKTSQVSETMTTETSSEEVTEIMMTGRAVGTAIDPSTGNWVVAVLDFDPASGQARVTRTVPSGSSKMESAERFKLVAVEEGVVV